MDKINRLSLVEQAYQRIKKEISSEKFSEGSKIPSENQLCKDLSVSRVVVRQALSRLREERIIVSYQGKGSFKANPVNFSDYGKNTLSFEEFNQVFDFRSAIEYASVNLAVRSATTEQLNSLIEVARQMQNCQDKNEFSKLDYEFHLSMIRCANNDLLLDAHENCMDKIIEVLSIMNELDGSGDYAIKLHLEIAQKMLLRDAKGVIALLKNNEEYNKARMSEIFNDYKFKKGDKNEN